MSPEDADRELDAAAKTNARWMRVHIDWHAIEKVQGQFDWGYVDHWVDGARQRGMKVLGLIVNTPEWAKAPGTALYGPPINAADYATFAATVVTRYRDRVSDWEIWNEPNLPRFLGFAERQAAVYTGLLKAAYPAIKSVQPDATVIAAGLSPAVGIDAPPNFLNDMYLNGAKGYFDAIGMHPYVFPGGIAADPSNGWSDLARAHDVMTLNGDGDKKVWLTEFGRADECAERGWGQPGGTGQADHRPACRGGGHRLEWARVHLQHPRYRQRQSGRPRGQLRSAHDHGLAAEVRRERARPVADHSFAPARIVGDIH